MNDEIRTRLGFVVERFGPEVVLDVRRCEALLRDLCAQFPRELNVLLTALRAGVVQEIHQSPVAGPSTLAARLVRRLEDDYAMAGVAARWAVDAWLVALGDGVESPSSGPGSSETSPSTAETDGGSVAPRSRLRERIERLLDDAATREHAGDWATAVEIYDNVLAMDATHTDAASLRVGAIRQRDRTRQPASALGNRFVGQDSAPVAMAPSVATSAIHPVRLTSGGAGTLQPPATPGSLQRPTTARKLAGVLRFPRFAVGTVQVGATTRHAAGDCEIEAAADVTLTLDPELSDFSFLRTCDPGKSLVTTLVARKCNVDGDFIDSLGAGLPALQVLDVSETSFEFHFRYNSKGALGGLRRLCCKECHISNLSFLKKISSLTHLDLSCTCTLGNYSLHDSGLKELRALASLQSLDLSGSQHITGLGVISNVDSMTALKSLNLTGCKSVTRERLTELRAVLSNTVVIA